MSDAQELSADEKANVARFGIHEDAEEATVGVIDFCMDSHLSTSELKEVLREYRSETGLSAYEWGELDVLDDQFINWFRWEKL